MKVFFFFFVFLPLFWEKFIQIGEIKWYYSEIVDETPFIQCFEWNQGGFQEEKKEF